MEDPFGKDVEIDEEFFEKSTIKDSKFKKKILFFFLGILIVLIMIAIGFLLFKLKSSEKKEDAIQMFSEINCTYLVSDNSSKIRILNDDLLNTSNILLIIDENLQDFSKFIKFESNGMHNIQIIIKDKFNMDNMFKNIDSLIKISMYSNSSTEIISK